MKGKALGRQVQPTDTVPTHAKDLLEPTSDLSALRGTWMKKIRGQQGLKGGPGASLPSVSKESLKVKKVVLALLLGEG